MTAVTRRFSSDSRAQAAVSSSRRQRRPACAPCALAEAWDRCLSWPLYKMCEPHVVMLIVTGLAVLAAVRPSLWLACWRSGVLAMAMLAPALARPASPDRSAEDRRKPSSPAGSALALRRPWAFRLPHRFPLTAPWTVGPPALYHRAIEAPAPTTSAPSPHSRRCWRERRSTAWYNAGELRSEQGSAPWVDRASRRRARGRPSALRAGVIAPVEGDRARLLPADRFGMMHRAVTAPWPRACARHYSSHPGYFRSGAAAGDSGVLLARSWVAGISLWRMRKRHTDLSTTWRPSPTSAAGRPGPARDRVPLSLTGRDTAPEDSAQRPKRAIHLRQPAVLL